MADKLTIDVDATGVLRMFNQLGEEAARLTKRVANVTAERIAEEARRRIRRRTGQTASGITVAPTSNGEGYVVYVQRPDKLGLPGWIEFGTIKMEGRSYLFNSAEIERGPHERRIREALQEACDAVSR
jgi:hypothetical protein